MISWLLQKIDSLLRTASSEQSGMIEGVDYEIVDADDGEIVDIMILRGPDQGQKIKIMRELLDENRNSDSEKSDVQ